MKVGDIVVVGVNKYTSYMGVISEINELEEMARIKDISGIEDNIQPFRCLRKATPEECEDELRSLYGYY